MFVFTESYAEHIKKSEDEKSEYIYVSTQSRNEGYSMKFQKNKEFKVFFLLLQLLDAQQPDSITTQVVMAFYLIPTFVTTDSTVCVYGG